MQHVTDSRIDLLHRILSCFGHWILEFETYLKFGACNLGFNPFHAGKKDYLINPGFVKYF